MNPEEQTTERVKQPRQRIKMSSSQRKLFQDPLAYARGAIQSLTSQLQTTKSKKRRIKLEGKIAYWRSAEVALLQTTADKLNKMKEKADAELAQKANEADDSINGENENASDKKDQESTEESS